MRRGLIWVLLTVGCGTSSNKPGVTVTGAGTGGTTAVIDTTGDASSIPDCHGEWPAAWIAKEDELTAAVNAARAKGGTCNGTAVPPVPAITANPQLTEISRCFARQQILAGSKALVGGAADTALRNQVLATNFPGQLSGYTGDVTVASADEVIAGVLANQYQCPVLFDPNTNLGGIGYVEEPSGMVQQRWAGVMAVESDTGTEVSLTTNNLPDWVHSAGPGMKVQRAGVNLSGAEFGTNVPGTYNKDYTYPTTSEVDYFVARGMNVFRIPFLWERLQPTLNNDLDSDEVARLTQIVSYATNAGAMAIIDPHNYARRGDAIIGSNALPDTAFADFWSKLATLFKDNARVTFGLMNEPHDMGSSGTEGWLRSANAAISAIRATSATNLILVPGDNWSGAWTWTHTANANVMQGVVDPAKNFAFDVHQYLDADGSGSGAQCVSQSIGVNRVSEFTTWARNAGVRAFLGEFAGISTPTCLHAIDGLLDYLGNNSDVWLGWSWWSAGPWWGDYPFSIEPLKDGTEAPQMVLLDRYLTKP